jgi:hypothetical protein
MSLPNSKNCSLIGKVYSAQVPEDSFGAYLLNPIRDGKLSLFEQFVEECQINVFDSFLRSKQEVNSQSISVW